MNILIITAHPSSTSFTAALCTEFSSQSRLQGHAVEILDLYQTDLQQPFLSFQSAKEFPQNAARSAIQAKITWADQLVFIHPIWWGSMPAILKNWIDQNLTSKFAYKYSKGGKAIGLLKPKTARLFITCDIPMWKYLMIGVPFMTTWYFAILDLCGLEVKSISVYSKMRKSTEQKRKRWLEQTKTIARDQPHKPPIILIVMRFFKNLFGL
jgi:NAD(P)H dehydrogenase (quinone)